MRVPVCGLWRLFPVVLILAAVGCGNSSGGKQAVTGTVSFKGQPLDQGTIEFQPEDQKGTFAGGTITNGKYEVPADKGLMPGKYKVKISSAEGKAVDADAPPGESGPPAKERIPANYNSKSDQFVEVSKDKSNEFNFDIK